MEKSCKTCKKHISCQEALNPAIPRCGGYEPDTPTATHPNYYHKGGIECFQAIDAATTDLQGPDAFDTGNALKYLWRWKEKNGAEDLKKAAVYIQRIIEREEK